MSKEFREFWIKLEVSGARKSEWVVSMDDPLGKHSRHLIEYSAYEAEKVKVNKLTDALRKCPCGLTDSFKVSRRCLCSRCYAIKEASKGNNSAK